MNTNIANRNRTPIFENIPREAGVVDIRCCQYRQRQGRFPHQRIQHRRTQCHRQYLPRQMKRSR